MKRHSAFLSYSSKDLQHVEEFKSHIMDPDLSFWHDRSELKGGDEWEIQIRRSITQSDALILFVSKNILNSFAENEFKIAKGLRRPIIPLILDNAIDLKHPLIDQIRTIHYIDLRNGIKQKAQEVLDVVKKAHICPVISLYNIKGGVGKTTLALHLSTYFFKQEKKRVLIVDTDPQTNLSVSLVLPEIIRKDGGLFRRRRSTETIDKLEALRNINKTVYGMLRNFLEQPEGEKQDFVLSEFIHNIDKDGNGVLDILAGDKRLKELATDADHTQTLKAIDGFTRFIGQCRKEYDVIFIDMNPSVSNISSCALTSTTHLVSPMRPDFYSMQGLDLLDDIAYDNQTDINGCKHFIVINDPREDRDNIVRSKVKGSKYNDNLFDSELTYSRYFFANPKTNTNPSLTNLPAYGRWNGKLRPDRLSLRTVATELADKAGIVL